LNIGQHEFALGGHLERPSVADRVHELHKYINLSDFFVHHVERAEVGFGPLQLYAKCLKSLGDTECFSDSVAGYH
jgi:hypothetical protein